MWHFGLLYKLKSLGVNGELLNWFESYLTDRHQNVVLNGVSSNLLPTKCGVPQGSVLGPLLFLVYVNDLCNDLSSKGYLFADDASLFTTYKIGNEIATVKCLMMI